MATQSELISFIESKYNCTFDGDSAKLVWSWTSDDRTQLVWVQVTDGFMRCTSPFARLDDVTPRQALEANASWQVGMQLQGDFYVIYCLSLIWMPAKSRQLSVWLQGLLMNSKNFLLAETVYSQPCHTAEPSARKVGSKMGRTSLVSTATIVVVRLPESVNLVVWHAHLSLL